ncbi:MAG: YdeI/OmpD-associated family protein [Gemmatimonadota bacterium]|nr:YdeI/OmpD-associated family protein [Gemmatimonadota bacterium]
MYRFQTTLVPGRKPPYASWTFLVIPSELAADWGPGRVRVRGTIAGTAFRGTATPGEGVLRMPVPRALREEAGVRSGDAVEVALEKDPDPPTMTLPDELDAVLNADPEVAALYKELPPSCRRAWAKYVAEAKRPETRLRRARKAPDGIRARAYPR